MLKPDESKSNNVNKDNNNSRICFPKHPEIGCFEWLWVIFCIVTSLGIGLLSLIVGQVNNCVGSPQLIIFLTVCGSIRIAKTVAAVIHFFVYAKLYMGILVEIVVQGFFMAYSIYASFILATQFENNTLLDNSQYCTVSNDEIGCNLYLYRIAWAIVIWNLWLLIRLVCRIERWIMKQYDKVSADDLAINPSAIKSSNANRPQSSI